MLCKRGISRHAVSVCVSVCPSVTFVDSVKTNNCIVKLLSPSDSHTKRHGNIPTGTLTGASNTGGVGRNRDSQPISTLYLHCALWTVPAASVIHLAAMDHGEFITLVAGKRRSLLMAGNNDKKPQRYAKVNRTAHLTARSDKSVAYVTNNWTKDYSTFCIDEANYRQTWSIARPLCDSRATCYL